MCKHTKFVAFIPKASEQINESEKNKTMENNFLDHKRIYDYYDNNKYKHSHLYLEELLYIRDTHLHLHTICTRIHKYIYYFLLYGSTQNTLTKLARKFAPKLSTNDYSSKDFSLHWEHLDIFYFVYGEYCHIFNTEVYLEPLF